MKHTEEEVERSFEDFYDDVHTEFLKFGEIVNFKVCKNGSSHLRGNVYVHYMSLESAMLAYQSINGRYFAGKQLTCEFVNVTRWRVAICGEYMKSRLKACSRGSACNFIHCFRNPGGDYEWADWDKPPPRYWLKEMAALFGYAADGFPNEVSPGTYHHSRRSRSRGLDSPHRKSEDDDGHRRRHPWRHRGDGREASKLDEREEKQTYQDYHSRRSRSRGLDSPRRKSEDSDGHRRKHLSRCRGDGREASSFDEREEKQTYQDYHCIKHREIDNFDKLDRNTDDRRSFAGVKRSSRKRGGESESRRQDSKNRKDRCVFAEEGGVSDRYLEHKCRRSNRQKSVSDSIHEHTLKKADKFAQEDGFQKKEPDFSNIDFHGDNLYGEEDRHHCHSKKRKKDEEELSSSASDEKGLSRTEKGQQKNRKQNSRLKKKTSAADSTGDSLNSLGDRKHRHRKRSLIESKNDSEIANDRGGHGRVGQRPQKNVRGSSSLKKQSGFTDTESDRDNDRLHRHRSDRKQHSRQMENDADSSDSAFDGQRLDREVKKSSLADLERNLPKQENTDDRYCGTSDRTAASYFMNPDIHEGNLCRFSHGSKCHDSSYGGLVSEKDHKSCDEELMLQINRNEEACTSGNVETSMPMGLIRGQVFDGEAEAELEKAYRHAALKKLEEIKKHKDTQAVHNMDPIESLRLCTHDNIVFKGVEVSRVPEESGSSKMETSVASTKRRRI